MGEAIGYESGTLAVSVTNNKISRPLKKAIEIYIELKTCKERLEKLEIFREEITNLLDEKFKKERNITIDKILLCLTNIKHGYYDTINYKFVNQVYNLNIDINFEDCIKEWAKNYAISFHGNDFNSLEWLKYNYVKVNDYIAEFGFSGDLEKDIRNTLTYKIEQIILKNREEIFKIYAYQILSKKLISFSDEI